jgi:alkylation response protein AidB-like acyl-CoA dehydrogenase
MDAYRAPLRDYDFLLNDLLQVPQALAACGLGEFDRDTIAQVLEAAGRFAREVIAPLSAVGDRQGCRMPEPGVVVTPDGFRAAYEQFAENGWTALACAPEHGGQGFPMTVDVAVYEMLTGANMGWAAYPGMSHAAYICLAANGSDAQKALYLPNIVSGRWAGTMCLTEPHAGTDLGLLRTRALPQPDGSHRVTGTKIFISGGEQDLTENIVHLVLARLPDAPPGVKGISLFIVPKRLPDEQGAAGARNALACGSIEHKLGIHANATCTMNFDGATGWLLGEPNRGLAAMFVMMNHARIVVGVNAIGLMEAARQKAFDYAQERVQGRSASGSAAPADPIVRHADVRRMLMTQRAYVEGTRALALWATLQSDLHRLHPDADVSAEAGDLLALMTPVVKAYSSDLAVESIRLAMQSHGGHGYIRDNGIEQILRDASIIPLYEGTNGVQAMDLLGRKVVPDGGRRLRAFIGLVRDTARADELPKAYAVKLEEACELVEAVTRDVVDRAATDAEEIGAAAVPFLRLVGNLGLGWMWARAVVASAAQPAGDPFAADKVATARFYFERLLPSGLTLAAEIRAGAASLREHEGAWR